MNIYAIKHWLKPQSNNQSASNRQKILHKTSSFLTHILIDYLLCEKYLQFCVFFLCSSWSLEKLAAFPETKHRKNNNHRWQRIAHHKTEDAFGFWHCFAWLCYLNWAGLWCAEEFVVSLILKEARVFVSLGGCGPLGGVRYVCEFLFGNWNLFVVAEILWLWFLW